MYCKGEKRWFNTHPFYRHGEGNTWKEMLKVVLWWQGIYKRGFHDNPSFFPVHGQKLEPLAGLSHSFLSSILDDIPLCLLPFDNLSISTDILVVHWKNGPHNQSDSGEPYSYRIDFVLTELFHLSTWLTTTHSTTR